MSCGLPVAAYPVPGPLDVIGQSGAGCLNEDLTKACIDALSIDRSATLGRAEFFSWTRCTEEFLSALVPIAQAGRRSVAPARVGKEVSSHHSYPMKG
jgi:glycosyltransferase involved in cell wall biosynthesis